MKYRHELKFLVGEQQIALLKLRLKMIMKQDANQNGDSYNIRSLYFDDLYDSCMHENESGIDARSKYRIRIYDKKSDVIKLEKKIKLHGMTRKEVATVNQEKCLQYMHGKEIKVLPKDTKLEKEFYTKIMANGMKPVTIVEYERTAFVEKRGNIRITFDQNISGCDYVHSFFEENIPLVPLLERGKHVLEVKYDEYFPDYIKDVLEIGSLQRISFSKYYYARNYRNI